MKKQFSPPPGKQEERKSMIDLIKSLEIIERASSDGAETVRRIQEFYKEGILMTSNLPKLMLISY